MITLENVLSEDNLYLAIEEICSKKDRKNEDGKSEIRELWDVNSEDIVEMMYKGIYEPKVVQQYEILKVDTLFNCAESGIVGRSKITV